MDEIVIPIERIEKAILMLRGHRVMLDRDLAELYQVTTANLNKAVKRNSNRFPDDFAFQITQEEVERLVFQTGISKKVQRGGSRYLPYAFTEQGVAMLSSVLRSERAVLVNIAIMRAFVRLRELLASNADLARKVNELEKRFDAQFQVVFEAIRKLMAPPPEKSKGRIGFRTPGADPDSSAEKQLRDPRAIQPQRRRAKKAQGD